MKALPRLSIIMPVLNESAMLEYSLQQLTPLRGQGAELIVVDGGSDDATAAIAASHADRLLHSERGRARQMNAGADAATGEILLFLHADTLLPKGALEAIVNGLATSKLSWGRFDVCISGKSRIFWLIASLMNLRSRLTGIATGDQAIFVQRMDFFAVGGFPVQDLMEDIELSRRLKHRSPPLCLHKHVTTSGRRWEQRGIWRTIWLMWRLRFLYWLGVPASRLAMEYR